MSTSASRSMDDQRQARSLGGGDVSSEDGALLVAGAEIIVVVQAGLADAGDVITVSQVD